jgi:hypothetical protein
MSFRRAGTAVLAAAVAPLALGGCYRSAVSLVPDADLVEVAELESGRYCAADLDWSGAVAVDFDDCRSLAFDAASRVYVETRAWEDANWSLTHRVVRLGDGVYLTEVAEPDPEEMAFSLVPFVVGEDGFAAIGDVLGDGFGAFAHAYADVVTSAPGPLGAGDIHRGDVQRARTLIELAARDDATAWAAGEGDQHAVIVYVRLGEGEDEAAARVRYETTAALLRARFVRLRR